MAEYLAPGVYVEEVSFRSKSIEGVPTSTTGFAGMTGYGPVRYPGGPSATEPRLVTNYAEYEQVYGGLGRLMVGSAGADARECYVAHAARAFFANGGRRLYLSRVFTPRDAVGLSDDDAWGIARATARAIGGGPATLQWRARWPGRAGNLLVKIIAVRSKNLAFGHPTFGPQAYRAKHGAVVAVFPPPASGAAEPDLTAAVLRVVQVDPATNRQTFAGGAAPGATDVIQLVELRVAVVVSPERVDVYDELVTDPNDRRFIGRFLARDNPGDENALVWLSVTAPGVPPANYAAQLLAALVDPAGDNRLAGGHDGLLATPDDLGGKDASPDRPDLKATGLAALGEVDDIAIVALPDSGTFDDEDVCADATSKLINHAESLRYRIAVLDAPANSSMTKIREFRARFDSKYAAIYHPWIEVFDPTERPAPGFPPRRLMLPPSGFVTGIYARSDVTRGVHKAPANEVVQGLTRFETNINKARQDVLNPEGINALRFFEGRGSRVWGARTISSDPEWKYVNVRRLFIYLEHSIDKGTQWAVFEPNNDRLWANVRQTIEDFLLGMWKDGALLGAKPEDAYFVRCDRTTMTQNDIDNGRMICLIGVAPVKPAEFVIFRVGQWTANSKVV